MEIAKMAKTPNYTEDQTKEIIAAYQEAAQHGYDAAAAAIDRLAEKLGRSTASIRQKLVREGVYKRKVYKTKQGVAPEKKEAIVDEIAAQLNLTDGEAVSLTKANKSALVKIKEAIN